MKGPAFLVLALPLLLISVQARANWNPLGAGANNVVTALAVSDSTLFVGGLFTQAGGAPQDHVAHWNGNLWLPMGLGINGMVKAMAFYNNGLIAAGGFTEADGQPANSIASWTGSSWRPLGDGISGEVHALTVYNGLLVAGGNFVQAGGQPANFIATWDGSSWNSLEPDGGGLEGIVNALCVYNGDLVVGGSFQYADNVWANGIARWDGAHWNPFGLGLTGSPTSVNTLVTYGDDLIAGGVFTTSGGDTVNYIARWDGQRWSPLGSGLNSSAQCLMTHSGDLIVGGNFTTAGGKPANFIAVWNGTWGTLGDGVRPLFQSEVACLAVYNYEYIAGGYFSEAGGISASNIARWNRLCLGPFALLSDGGTGGPIDSLHTTKPELRWRRTPNQCLAATVHYILFWSEEPDFGGADSTECASDTTFTFPPGLLSVDGTYYWRVKAQTEVQHRWSDPPSGWSFYIVNDQTPCLIEPEAAATEDGILISWSVPAGYGRSGFRLERRPAGELPEEPWEPVSPLLTQTGGECSFLDREVEPGTRYEYIVDAFGPTGPAGRSGPVSAVAGTPRLALRVVPDPSAGEAQVVFTLPKAGDVVLRVYDVRGREVAKRAFGRLRAGVHGVRWDAREANGRDLACGSYFVRMDTPSGHKVIRWTLVR